MKLLLKAERYKSPDIDQIPAEIIEESGNTLHFETTNLVIVFGIRKRWKESVIAPVYKKG
jgi:hypothetical protein